MNYCPNCGEKVDEESRFCKYCGTRLVYEPEAEVQHKSTVQTYEIQPETKGDIGVGKGCLMSFIGIIVAVGIIITIVIIVASNYNADPGTDNNYDTAIESETESGTESNTEPETAVESSPYAELTEEEYKAACAEYSYEEIFRNPNAHDGELAKFKGEVVQVMESSVLGVPVTYFRINVTAQKYDYIDAVLYTDTIYALYFPPSGDGRILENDIVNIWGELDGLETYTAIAGNEVTIPCFIIKYIELA